MLVSSNQLIGLPVLSMQSTGRIGTISALIIDPAKLQVVAFELIGPLVTKVGANILVATSIREHADIGLIVDSIDELVRTDDVVKISKLVALHFNLTGLKVVTKKGSRLGTVTSFTATTDDYLIQQIIVRRPLVKSFVDPELTIPRHEIAEVTDYKVIVKDEEKTIRARATHEDFVPNFVNPFRKSEQPAHAQSRSQTPADTNTE